MQYPPPPPVPSDVDPATLAALPLETITRAYRATRVAEIGWQQQQRGDDRG